MSYILTEVAMEMLGWRYYDENGVARPINFEGTGAVCEGVPNLAVTLGIAPPSGCSESVIQAEADSSSHVSHQATDVGLDDVGALLKESILNETSSNGNEGNKYAANLNMLYTNEPTAQPATDTIMADNLNANLINQLPFALKIQHVQGGYDASKAEETSNKIKKPITQSMAYPNASTVLEDQSNSPLQPSQPTMNNDSADMVFQNGAQTNHNAPAFIDVAESIEVEEELQLEMDRIKTDLKCHKSIYFKAVPDAFKSSESSFQRVFQSYRHHELKNLGDNLSLLKSLRRETERKVLANFGDTFPKYKSTCDAMEAREKLLSSKVTVEEMKRKQPVARNKTYSLSQ